MRKNSCISQTVIPEDTWSFSLQSIFIPAYHFKTFLLFCTIVFIVFLRVFVTSLAAPKMQTFSLLSFLHHVSLPFAGSCPRVPGLPEALRRLRGCRNAKLFILLSLLYHLLYILPLPEALRRLRQARARQNAKPCHFVSFLIIIIV